MIAVNDIAKLVGGTVIGDGSVTVSGLSTVDLAKEGDMTFILSGDDAATAGKGDAVCVVTTTEVKDYPKTVLLVKDMKTAITVIYNAMQEILPPEKGSIHPSAVVPESVKIGKNVSIGANAVIGEDATLSDNSSIGAGTVIGRNVKLGARSCLAGNVTVYDNTVIGDKVIIHSGAVIGADGFGFLPKDGKVYKVPQMGKVVIGNNVEIGANACIDRGTFTDTVIGEGTKIDNQVQIAHNVKIGKNVLVAAQTGIAGSTTVGENTMMGGQVGIADHVKIGKNVKLAANTGISGNVEDGETRLRYPARSPLETKKLDRIMILMLRNADKFGQFLKNLSK